MRTRKYEVRRSLAATFTSENLIKSLGPLNVKCIPCEPIHSPEERVANKGYSFGSYYLQRESIYTSLPDAEPSLEMDYSFSILFFLKLVYRHFWPQKRSK